MTFLRKFLGITSQGTRPRGPDGYRAYAVGDVHGCLSLLNEILDKIESDIVSRQPCKNLLIFLGDLIDRGPQSSQVIERLLNWRCASASAIFLSGNHEEVLLRVLNGDENILSDWLSFGGAECLSSYGLSPVELAEKNTTAALAEIRAAIPIEHYEFISSFADTLRFGDYLFVHAGIRPGVDLKSQSKEDLHWIREPFLTDKSNHSVTIIHGHTISKTIDERVNRIGIDTGAYQSGVLTALAIEGADRWYINTCPNKL